MAPSRWAKSGARGRVGLAGMDNISNTKGLECARKLRVGMVGVRIVSGVKRAMRAMGGEQRFVAIAEIKIFERELER